ncbi:hypothetical protein EGW08_007372, partial [Elysia chlorotica]
IGYAVVELSDLTTGVKLGLLALSCSPGGAGSNAYAYLLGGDVSLSLTMTIVSTTMALVLLPLWLFTLGSHIINEKNNKIHIPYHIIMGALVGIIVPCIAGIYIRRRHPRLAQFLVASIKYLMVLFVVLVGTAGVWLNWFVFQLMAPKVLLASALIPYIGFFLGGLFALVMGQSKKSIVTIAVETGIQNNGVPIVMMRLSLTGPERDTSIVGPIASAILSTQPLLLAVFVLHCMKKCEWPAREVDLEGVPEDHPEEVEQGNKSSGADAPEIKNDEQQGTSIKSNLSTVILDVNSIQRIRSSS